MNESTATAARLDGHGNQKRRDLHLITPLARQFWSMASISFLLLSAIYILVPVLRKPLVNEDLLLEMCTALMFLAVAILTTRYQITRAGNAEKWVGWMLAALATLGFLEEVSFARLFFSESPVVHGIKVDAIHDFLRVVLELNVSSEHIVLLSLLTIGFAAMGAAIAYWLRHQIRRLFDNETFRFCVLCLAFVGLASIADLNLTSHFYLPFLEEFVEALAALALVFGYRALCRTDGKPIA